MGAKDPFNFADSAKRIIAGTESSDLVAARMEFSHLTDVNQRDLVKLFVTDCDTYIKGFIQRDDYSTDASQQ